MYEREYRKEVDGSIETRQALEQLESRLPDIASSLIEETQNMELPSNQLFADNPDDPAEHAPKWHQFGVVTHSRRFVEALQQKVPEHLARWGLDWSAQAALEEQIDGVAKHDLLPIAAILHDVGKFTARRVEYTDGQISTDFKGHEEASGQLIRTVLAPALQEFSLSDPHIEYIARCGELHFELGKLRREARKRGSFNMAFVESPAFLRGVDEIITTNTDFAWEIGLLFFADNSSKSEVVASGETDEEIEEEQLFLRQELASRGLHPYLIHQALQYPVGMRATERYLQRVEQRLQ